MDMFSSWCRNDPMAIDVRWIVWWKLRWHNHLKRRKEVQSRVRFLLPIKWKFDMLGMEIKAIKLSFFVDDLGSYKNTDSNCFLESSKAPKIPSLTKNILLQFSWQNPPKRSICLHLLSSSRQFHAFLIPKSHFWKSCQNDWFFITYYFITSISRIFHSKILFIIIHW